MFPNRRSMAFFRKYLGESVAADDEAVPFAAPEMLTINDFFSRAGGLETTDRIPLLLELYSCYKRIYDRAETLDDFIFWGDVLLGDFDDADKYLADPGRLFANVSDFRSIQDNYSYLSERQRAAIDAFVSHFRSGDGRMTVDTGTDDPNVKARFLLIWNILFRLYSDFNEALMAKGMAYEGMVYRSLAERIREESAADVLRAVFPDTDSYVFVGLNALNECEKTVLRRMRDAGLAEFCWDYSGDFIKDPRNKSSFFMKDNVREFPQAPGFIADPDGVGIPEIRVVSVPSAVGQAKLLPALLAGHGPAASGDWVRTAVVLPDELLLTTVLNSIPPEIEDINVTMGYPMKGSSPYALLSAFNSLQLHLRERGGEWSFYHRQVRSVFSDSLFRRISTDEEKAVAARIRGESKYYVPRSDLAATPLLEAIFRPVALRPDVADAAQIKALQDYQSDLLELMDSRLREVGDMPGELDFIRHCMTAVNMLRSVELEVMPATYMRILDRILSGISVPFLGEPLRGLQIMGPLETRALDFDHIIILSANEGVFPHRTVSSSFIPPELRKGFGLPTYEFQDAVWAYYFYRMISRASTVCMVCDSRTDGIRPGEESRFIKQLEYHFRLPVQRFTAVSELHPVREEETIVKTEEDIAVIRSSELSATALQRYITCPAKFYYANVKRLKPEEEVAESMDSRMVGNVYHAVMQAIYMGGEAMRRDFPMKDRSFVSSAVRSPLEYVTADYLRDLLRRLDELRDRIRFLVCEEMNMQDISGRNLVLENVILQYVLRTLKRDIELMESYGTGRMKVLGLEAEYHAEFAGLRFKGYVDRIDSLREDEVRVVDYKTGHVDDKYLETDGPKASETVGKLFGDKEKDRPKVALQLFLYDLFLRGDSRFSGKEIVNSVYSVSELFTSGVRSFRVGDEFAAGMTERLHSLLHDMTDVSVPFSRTEDRDACKICDFKIICGR